MTHDDIVHQVTQKARGVFPALRRLLLFGSRARGDAKPDSDDDLLVVTPPAWRHVCFLCQQAGEKAVNAVLEAEGLPVMRTHDIPALVNLLAARHHDATSMLTCAAILTGHTIGPRYPGVAGQAGGPDHHLDPASGGRFAFPGSGGREKAWCGRSYRRVAI